MFDEVTFDCPHCGQKDIMCIQSKGGDCSMSRYPIATAPDNVRADIIGDESKCWNCLAVVKIEGSVTVVTVPVMVKAGIPNTFEEGFFEGKIKLMLERGLPRIVDAWIKGPLAVHYNGPGYAATHIPSGLLASIHEYPIEHIWQGRRLISKLLSPGIVDWESIQPGRVTREIGDKIRALLSEDAEIRKHEDFAEKAESEARKAAEDGE